MTERDIQIRLSMVETLLLSITPVFIPNSISGPVISEPAKNEERELRYSLNAYKEALLKLSQQ